MKVYVTPREFDALQKAKLKADTTQDVRDRDVLIGMLSACCMDNGGDYNPDRHRAGVNCEIVVVTAREC